MAAIDEVRLAVPAAPEYLRLARVTAAGLASRMGFSFDEVEDLRLAIDELCYGLTGHGRRTGTVEIRYTIGTEALVVEGDGRFEAPGPEDAGQKKAGQEEAGSEEAGSVEAGSEEPGSEEVGSEKAGVAHGLSELSRLILTALVDEFELVAGEAGPRFRLVKRRRGPVPSTPAAARVS